MILPHAFSILYSFVRFLLEILLVRTSSEARLRAEVLALRRCESSSVRSSGRTGSHRTGSS